MNPAANHHGMPHLFRELERVILAAAIDRDFRSELMRDPLHAVLHNACERYLLSADEQNLLLSIGFRNFCEWVHELSDRIEAATAMTSELKHSIQVPTVVFDSADLETIDAELERSGTPNLQQCHGNPGGHNRCWPVNRIH